eukprot:767060-Hanusia_phi.AAC.2
MGNFFAKEDCLSSGRLPNAFLAIPIFLEAMRSLSRAWPSSAGVSSTSTLESASSSAVLEATLAPRFGDFKGECKTLLVFRNLLFLAHAVISLTFWKAEIVFFFESEIGSAGTSGSSGDTYIRVMFGANNMSSLPSVWPACLRQ